jgi:hypothetical protein
MRIPCNLGADTLIPWLLCQPPPVARGWVRVAKTDARSRLHPPRCPNQAPTMPQPRHAVNRADPMLPLPMTRACAVGPIAPLGGPLAVPQSDARAYRMTLHLTGIWSMWYNPPARTRNLTRARVLTRARRGCTGVNARERVGGAPLHADSIFESSSRLSKISRDPTATELSPGYTGSSAGRPDFDSHDVQDSANRHRVGDNCATDILHHKVTRGENEQGSHIAQRHSVRGHHQGVRKG